MKSLFLLIIVSVSAIVYGQVSFENVPVENVKLVCVSSRPEVGTLQYGETKTLPGKCVGATCGRGLITYAGCGTMSVVRPCRLTPEDLTKQYPDCCPDVTCDDDK